MSAQDAIIGARAVHIRELKAEIAKLRAENQRLRDEAQSLKTHFDLALVAARDLESLGEGGRIVVLDGWNMILGSQRTAMSREDLVRQAKAMAAANPNDRVWIVFDGPHASSAVEDGVRITYTGGTGPHRADRFVCDFLRMAALSGRSGDVEVVTDDRRFGDEARRLAARIGGPRP